VDTLYLDLIGGRIRVTGDSPRIREGVLGAVPLLACAPFDGPPDLAYDFRTLAPGEPLPDFSTYRNEAGSTAQDFEFLRKGGERWVVVGRRSAARFALEEGSVHVRVHRDHLEDPWTIGHRLFFLPLLEWMRCRGLYPLHGSSFLAGGRGVVVCGPSGVGKSTATLAAIAAGCPFAADDTLFAVRKGGTVALRPFPEPVKVGAETARFFPELRDRLRSIGPKYLLSEEALPPPGRVSEVVPEVLLFPEIADRERSRFDPLTGEEAMVRLLPQSVLPSDRDQVEAHIGILADLVRQAPAYRLRFGRDPRDLPARVAGLASGIPRIA
jgi:hypothetical protein